MRLSVFSEAPAFGGLDSRLIATIRLVLSSSVLFIIGSSELDDLGPFDMLAVLYTIYSLIVYIFADRLTHPAVSSLSLWADVSWAAILTMASDDASTAFIFLFPTLITSFQRSFAVAWRLTLVVAQLLLVIGFLKMQLDPDLQLPEILLPPLYLLVFGYLVARWGDRESAAKRRLVLLKEITRLSNPRFGIDRTISTMMERLRTFYDADACLMVMSDTARGEHLLRRADRRDPERAMTAESIAAETAQLLLAPPLNQAIIYLGAPHTRRWWRFPKARYHVFDVRDNQRNAAAPPMDETLITMVDAESLISVPLHDSNSTAGRLYLTTTRRSTFASADVSFLLQVVEQIIPLIENIRLIDQLASNAAKEERHRLARDIHDNVIQPYIGFQIGLAAVSEKLNTGASDIANDIAKLKAITAQGIDDLRHYIHRLPGTDERESVLLGAVRRFATTFTETTDIVVQVEAGADLHINDRLAAEIFQMVVEGLTNIKRHTRAVSVGIGLARHNNCLILQISNDKADATRHPHFTPWSITERAAALGGRTRVEHVVEGVTQVIVEIPL